MKLIRTFHPVGHGAFYTERFYDENGNNIANVVYDCGSKTISHQDLDAIINSEFRQGENINFVFISHFHDDHVSGILSLCRRCHVQSIVVPSLPNDYKIWTMLYNAIKYGLNSRGNELLKNFETGDLEGTDITFVEHQHDIPLAPNNQPLLQWRYHAYRLPNYSKTFSRRYATLINALRSNPAFAPAFNAGQNIDFDVLYKILTHPQNITTLRRLINQNNIRLNENNFNMVVSSQRSIPFAHNNSFQGCLYTGDAELKAMKRMRSLQHQVTLNKQNYDIIQVPHHGAFSNNHNITLYDNLQLCIISAQKNDRHHPHLTTLNDIISKNCLPKIVSEDNRSHVKLTYTI